MSDTTETETETNTNTDEPSKAELHERVQQVESTVAKMMPSRRDALRMGAAGIAGAAGLGAASQSADAATGSAGTIGSSSDRPDLFADEIDANTLSGSVKNQGCRVFLSSNQSITKNNIAQINFDSQEYDSGNNFDLSANEWICPRDGVYAVNLQVAFISGSNGDRRRAQIGTISTQNTSGEGAANFDESSSTNDRLTVSTINKYNQGDGIAGYARNRDSNDTIEGTNLSNRSFLEVVFIGGL